MAASRSPLVRKVNDLGARTIAFYDERRRYTLWVMASTNKALAATVIRMPTPDPRASQMGKAARRSHMSWYRRRRGVRVREPLASSRRQTPNFQICLRMAWRTSPARSLRAASRSFAAIASRSWLPSLNFQVLTSRSCISFRSIGRFDQDHFSCAFGNQIWRDLPLTGNSLSVERSSRFSVPCALFRCPTNSPDSR
jgi:hypothetical protein